MPKLWSTGLSLCAPLSLGFLHDIIVKMIPTMRQHAVTWIGKTRVGKSVGSKTMLFAQSRFEIAAADRSDLVPSIVTANHLDFFKAEPLTKLKPGMFDDGLLQKMDASFLKAFLNPAAPWLHRFSVYSCLSPSCCILSSFTYQIYPCPWDSLLCFYLFTGRRCNRVGAVLFCSV